MCFIPTLFVNSDKIRIAYLERLIAGLAESSFQTDGGILVRKIEEYMKLFEFDHDCPLSDSDIAEIKLIINKGGHGYE